jgi:hypothetical protein
VTSDATLTSVMFNPRLSLKLYSKTMLFSNATSSMTLKTICPRESGVSKKTVVAKLLSSDTMSGMDSLPITEATLRCLAAFISVRVS